ncbi:YciI family protein [Catellatospora tritici]|uniref:YciI family protein n=1 Tax=Catellatospora tritici TaxID=2851566 RepID=UPI001C2CEC58|nr:YciI family protein [Catellatospora tritici]MBV1849315.1 YciI family protein [Catellatospora tritici]
MAEWIYFVHPPRDNFRATLDDEERAVFDAHVEYLLHLYANGKLILSGPTLGTTNTGIIVIEADDEAAAAQIMNDDPAISSGLTQGELRPFLAALLRGRDHSSVPVFDTETRHNGSPASVTV